MPNSDTKNKLNIIMLTPHVGHGGDWIIIKSLVERLSDEGHNVILGTSYSDKLKLPVRVSKVFLTINEGFFGFLNSLFFIPYFKGKIDIIHAHSPIAALYGLFIKIFFGGKIIYTHHWDVPDSYFRKKMKRLLFKKIDVVHCYSIGSMRLLKENYGISDRKLILAYIGVNASKFFPGDDEEKKNIRDKYKIQKNKIVISFVGRLNPEKNIPIILRYLDRHRDDLKELFFVAAGDGPCYKELVDKVNELRIRDRVLFVGYLVQPRDIYVLSDLLVLPSLIEAFPLVAIEAFLCGIPVFRSNISGALEQIIPGETGDYYELGDEDDFDMKLTGLIRDPWELRVMGEHARSLALEKFTFDKMYENILGLYHKAILQ